MTRATVSLLLTGSIVLAYGVSSVQEPKKAEDEFKNIQSFKGVPATEIIPAMQFMSASLGVECQFCHNPKGFELDDVRAKEAARHMIAMTHDINVKNFGGRNRVTCFTCHGGRVHPIPTPSSFGATPNFQPDSSLTADQVIGKFRSALGPDSAISGLKSVRLVGTATQDTEKPEAVTLDQASPNRFVITRGTPKGPQILGFNGTDTWVSFAGFGTRKLDEPTNEIAQRFGKAFRDSSSMPQYEALTIGKAPVGTKTDVVIRGNLPARHERDLYYFDPKTGLLDRVAYFTTTILGDLPEVYDYSDYKRVAGVMVPFTVVQHNQSVTTTVKFRHAQANPMLPSSEFDVPAAAPGK